MKVLVIEDDAGLNRGICFALKQEGCEAVSARTLREGYAFFERENPDAVILDLNLPDGDGQEFCKRIRELPGTGAETAILMLTARDLETTTIGAGKEKYFELWLDVERRYDTTCRKINRMPLPLWFDVEKR